MIHLPPRGSELRETLDVEHVVEVCNPANRSLVPLLHEARKSARRHIAASQGLVRSVQTICMLPNDDLALVRVGARGGFSVLWNFTRGE